MNRPAWKPGQSNGHVESYFLKWNDVAKQTAVWLKFTFFVPRGQPQNAVGEVWAIWFDAAQPSANRAWKQSFPLSTCQVSKQPLQLQFGANQLEDRQCGGSLMSPSGRISWNINWTDGADPLTHFPYDWMYGSPLPKSKLTAPNPSSLFSGWVEIDGQRIDVDQAPGTLGHNWGREHAWHYAWAHCNAFDGHGPDTWFEGASSRIKVGGWVTPYLSLGHLCLDGKRYAFNRLRDLTASKVSVDTTRWRFRLESPDNALIGEFAAPPDRFMCLHYRNPDDQLGYCLNSKVAYAKLELRDRHDRYIAKLESRSTAALEVLVRNADHGIRFGA